MRLAELLHLLSTLLLVVRCCFYFIHLSGQSDEHSLTFITETVTKKTKEVTGMENAGSKAKGAMYEAEGSAENLTGQASGKASEMAGKAKGKAAEIGGDLKGKANEVEGAAKGRSAELQGASGTAKPGVKGM